MLRAACRGVAAPSRSGDDVSVQKRLDTLEYVLCCAFARSCFTLPQRLQRPRGTAPCRGCPPTEAAHSPARTGGETAPHHCRRRRRLFRRARPRPGGSCTAPSRGRARRRAASRSLAACCAAGGARGSSRSARHVVQVYPRDQGRASTDRTGLRRRCGGRCLRGACGFGRPSGGRERRWGRRGERGGDKG